MIKIISHRGYWTNLDEKNQKNAFKRSWDHGFGIETDIRDFNQNLVISHDMASPNCLHIDDFFNLSHRVKKSFLLIFTMKISLPKIYRKI